MASGKKPNNPSTKAKHGQKKEAVGRKRNQNSIWSSAAFQFACGIACVFLVSCFPVFFLYFHNASLLSGDILWQSLVLFLLVGMGIFLLVLVLVRNVAIACLIAVPFIMGFQYFTVVEHGLQQVFTTVSYPQVLLILLFVLAHLAVLIHRKLPKELAQKIVAIICVVMLFMTGANGLLALPDILANRSTSTGPMDEIAPVISTTNEEYPNIYYFIYDEYASIAMMQKYFEYDNTPFVHYLEELGFTVSSYARNPLKNTMLNVSNNFALDYRVSYVDFSLPRVKETNKQNATAQMLHSLGYQMLGMGNLVIPGIMDSLNGTEADATQSISLEGLNFQELLLQNTLLAPFLAEDINSTEKQAVLDQIDYFSDPDQFVRTRPFFTFAYVLSPHIPYIFRADGSENPLNKYQELRDPEYYLEQYIFITNVMKQNMQNIIENDPNCIIILQSDHGLRHLQDAEGNEIIDEESKHEIFNAVYYRGMPVDIEGLSSVNTLRKVYSMAFDIDLPAVPDEIEGES